MTTGFVKLVEKSLSKCISSEILMMKGDETGMSVIAPISDLRNYGTVLENVKDNKPVYLTRNGRDAYVIRTMKDEERLQKAEAMIQLFCELNAGIRSAEESGWITEEDLKALSKKQEICKIVTYSLLL